jgi:hypothetical protein
MVTDRHGYNREIPKSGIFDEYIGDFRRQAVLQYPILKDSVLLRGILERS